MDKNCLGAYAKGQEKIQLRMFQLFFLFDCVERPESSDKAFLECIRSESSQKIENNPIE